MGLKGAFSTIIYAYTAGLKSDQNGIESAVSKSSDDGVGKC